MNEIDEVKSFMKLLAEESGRIIKKYFRTKISVDSKFDNSPVTIADKSAEERLRELIMKEFPSHGIIGEEFGVYNEEAEFKWLLDPIDGTKSFISGAVTFGTLIAFTKNNYPAAGVFNQPILNEFLLGDNSSALLNGSSVSVRNCSSIEDAVLLTTDHLHIEKYHNMKKFDALIRKVKLYRNWGDCYGYYLLSTGFADVMIDPFMSVWDTAALIPIVKGAGGTITDYHGRDALEGNSVIAAAPQIHSKIVELLN
jgi:histidinol phosphatase-like enzyme (inositol monophosphatase family)